MGKALLVYAAMAVIVLPWTVRNYLVFDAFVPVSTNGGFTLLTGNNPSAQGGYTDNDPLVRKVSHSVSGQVAADHLATSLALTWIREHPAAFVALIPKKVWRLWAPDGEGEWAFKSGFNHYDDYSATVPLGENIQSALLFLYHDLIHGVGGLLVPRAALAAVVFGDRLRTGRIFYRNIHSVFGPITFSFRFDAVDRYVLGMDDPALG